MKPSLTLWILVEGDDDLRLFQRLLVPALSKKHDAVKFWKYSCEKNERRENLIHSIEAMKQQYIYVVDIDDASCVTDKKQRVFKQLDGKIRNENVAVVIKEIEGWYLAGAGSKMRSLMHLSLPHTDQMTKEQFNNLIPARMPRAQFMQEILDDFDLSAASTKNLSFSYFMRKWVY